MLFYLIKRVLLLIPILVGVTLIAFVITRLLPGDPARIYAGMNANEATVQRIRASFGLDDPLPIQYLNYLQDLIVGDLGTSIRTRNDVIDDLVARAPATIELALMAITIAALVGVPMGIYAAIRRGGRFDKFGRVTSSVGQAFPDFWLGLLLIIVFFVNLDIAPPPVGRLGILDSPPGGPTGLFVLDGILTGKFDTAWTAFRHLILPSLALAIPAMGPLFRLTRNATIDVLASDYILFARAAGASGRNLYPRYVLRNAIPNTITVGALIFGYLIGGAVLVETVFSWPGLGLYAKNSLDFNDYASVQGFVLLAAVVYLLVFLLLDIIHSWLDPRVRIS